MKSTKSSLRHHIPRPGGQLEDIKDRLSDVEGQLRALIRMMTRLRDEENHNSDVADADEEDFTNEELAEIRREWGEKVKRVDPFLIDHLLANDTLMTYADWVSYRAEVKREGA